MRRTLRMTGLAACFVLALSGCPAEEGPSASDGSKSAEGTDHSHRWDREGENRQTSQGRKDSPAPVGDGVDGEEASDEGAGGEAPEATIVHSELGPEELVRHYLMLGSAGDLSRIADYVEPRCYKGPIGRVDAVRLVGTLLTLDALTIASVFQTEEKARVNYHLVGGVTAGEKKFEISIEGEEVGERTGILTTSGIERRGSLDLTYVDSLWRVTCTFSYVPPEETAGITP